jgi:hypothetical protein
MTIFLNGMYLIRGFNNKIKANRPKDLLDIQQLREINKTNKIRTLKH